MWSMRGDGERPDASRARQASTTSVTALSVGRIEEETRVRKAARMPWAVGLLSEEVVRAIGEIGAESLENRCGAARGAEAAERGEVGESDEHLGLVVVVAIVAQRRVQSETGGGLRGEGFRGVIPARGGPAEKEAAPER